MDLLRKDNIPQYDLLRVTAMLLVVMGHSLLMPTEAFDEYPYTIVELPGCKIAKLASYVYFWLGTFRLPAFMALSGALMYVACVKKGHDNFGKFVERRWKRLILPLFGVTVFYVLPINIIVWNSYCSLKVTGWMIFDQFLFEGGSTHLWFLGALFWIQIFAYPLFCLKHRFTPPPPLILAITLIMWMLLSDYYDLLVNPFFVVDACRFMVWFCVGYYFEQCRTAVDSWISRYKWILFPSVLLFFLYPWIDFGGNAFLSRISPVLAVGLSSIRWFAQSLVGMWLLYLLCYLVVISRPWKGIQSNSIFRFLRKYCYEFYLYSAPLNYFVILGMLMLTGDFYRGNIGFGTLILLRFLLTILVTVVVIGVINWCKKLCQGLKTQLSGNQL